MDPNCNLSEQLSLAVLLVADNAEEPDQSAEMADARRLAELVLSLDEWIVEKRGFAPERWVPGEVVPTLELAALRRDAAAWREFLKTAEKVGAMAREWRDGDGSGGSAA